MSDGYDAVDIADLVVRKTEAFRARRIDDVIPAEALQPTLAAVAAAGDRVLDFGGAAGFHYLTASQAHLQRAFRWAVVERPVMVEWAKHLEQDGLRFFTAIEDAVQWLGGVDLLHSNGVLQYLDAPEAMLERLLALKSRHVLWGRMLLGESRATEIQISPLSDHGPGPAPPGFVDRQVTHTRVRMSQSTFLAVHRGFRIVWQSADSFLFVRQ